MKSLSFDNELEKTILDKYDSLILDLDKTIWQAFSPKGDEIGAFQTDPPYKLKDGQTIVDIKGSVIQLQPGVRDFLFLVDDADKNLGIVSRGEKLADVNNRISVPYEAQPSIMLLKKFDLYKYFNLNIVLKAFGEKQFYVKPEGRTLFIDDDREWLSKVDEQGKVDVLWRGSFQNWMDLLTAIV